jgi:hypothetical protein
MEISQAFAELCAAADESLADAFFVLRGWLQPLRRPDMAVRELDESGLCKRFPMDAPLLSGHAHNRHVEVHHVFTNAEFVV